MKSISIIIFWYACAISFAQPVTPRAISLQLKLKSTTGTNGNSVAWHPATKMYYTIIAGNADYPIDIFDERGTCIKSQESGIDNRGIWFNPKSKKLEGKTNDGQLFSWTIDETGELSNPKLIKESIGIEGQFVVCFGNGYYYYHEEGIVKKVSLKGKATSIQLARPSSEDQYNQYGMGYTSVKNYEIILLKPSSNTLEFYNLKGALTASIVLPGTFPDLEAFRFSYANKMVWLYDVEARVWSGYKVFNQ